MLKKDNCNFNEPDDFWELEKAADEILGDYLADLVDSGYEYKEHTKFKCIGKCGNENFGTIRYEVRIEEVERNLVY